MAGARRGTTTAVSKPRARSALSGGKAPARTASAPDTPPEDRHPRQQLGYLAPRRIRRAYDALVEDQVAKGTQDLRVSARVDPGILEAAARNLGLTQPSDVVNAAIIAAAAQDPFKSWFLTAAGTLPDEFELAV